MLKEEDILIDSELEDVAGGRNDEFIKSQCDYWAKTQWGKLASEQLMNNLFKKLRGICSADSFEDWKEYLIESMYAAMRGDEPLPDDLPQNPPRRGGPR